MPSIGWAWRQRPKMSDKINGFLLGYEAKYGWHVWSNGQFPVGQRMLRRWWCRQWAKNTNPEEGHIGHRTQRGDYHSLCCWYTWLSFYEDSDISEADLGIFVYYITCLSRRVAGDLSNQPNPCILSSPPVPKWMNKSPIISNEISHRKCRRKYFPNKRKPLNK